MSQSTFLIICAAFIAVPFVVSCVKGDPFIGLVGGIASFLLMAFAAHNGASMLGIHVIGLLVGGYATARSLRGN